jgi:hypothetical protein
MWSFTVSECRKGNPAVPLQPISLSLDRASLENSKIIPDLIDGTDPDSAVEMSVTFKSGTEERVVANGNLIAPSEVPNLSSPPSLPCFYADACSDALC